MSSAAPILECLGDGPEVVDGDTFRVRLAEAHPLYGPDVLIRLAGCDAPEPSRDPLPAAHATLRLAEILAGATTLEVRGTGARAKYGGRVVCQVLADGRDVSEMLIGEGHAVPYDGRSPRSGRGPRGGTA